MPFWESNELFFLSGLSIFFTFAVFIGLVYISYKQKVAHRRCGDAEQAALEKVLLRKEAITSTSPPTKPLIVSPSFSSPNKVPARHLRSGSYSPTHYHVSIKGQNHSRMTLSPYHSRQPRRNSSPTSHFAAIQQPRLPQLQLHHPQLEEEDQDYYYTHLADEVNIGTAAASSHVSPIGNTGNNKENACAPLINPNNDNEPQEQQNNNKVNAKKKGKRNNVPGSLAHHNSQYYGTIPPRRMGRHSVVAPAESNLVGASNANPVAGAFLPSQCGSGAVIVPHLKHNSFIKGEYAQLPGKDGADYQDDQENCKDKDDNSSAIKEKNKWKNCSDADDGSLRRKLLLQKQYQQKLQLQQQQQHHSHHHRLATEPPGELFKMKHTVSEEIPYYISTQ